MDLFRMVQILGDVGDISDDCGGLLFLVKIIRQGIFPILQIGVPIILIVLGTLDLGKAVISSDEKQVKEAQSKLIKRCIYAVAVFFIVTIVNVLMTMIANVTGSSDTTNWKNCWNAAGR